jgi:hypothetical protein
VTTVKDYARALGRWGWVVVGQAIFGAVQGYLSLTASPWHVIPLWGWLTMLIVGLVVGPLLAFRSVNNKLKRIISAKPSIRITKTENVFGDVINFRNNTREHPWFTRIHVVNDPLVATEDSEDKNVVGHISFYRRGNSKCLLEMIGRWAETQEIASGGQPIEIEQILLPPNAQPFIMDIGLKYRDEDEFYAYNNETPRKKTRGFRDTSRSFPAGEYLVRVEFRGTNVRTALEFILSNPGKGKEVSLHRVNGGMQKAEERTK